MQYVSNPKHSDPWQRGRRGSLCPLEVRPLAQELLDSSVADGTKRYATHEGKAYCAQQTPSDLWHGYPVGWKHVPVRIRQAWRSERRVRRSDINRNWD